MNVEKRMNISSQEKILENLVLTRLVLSAVHSRTRQGREALISGFSYRTIWFIRFGGLPGLSAQRGSVKRSDTYLGP